MIETYLRRTERSVILRENCGPDEGGALSRTRYRVICRKDGATMVCAVPLTGRTHQLRVHFAGLGCPMEGDELYGRPSPHIGRHALHSALLSFPLPCTGERMTLRAPLPDDLRQLAELRFGALWEQRLTEASERLFEELLRETT